VSTTFHDKRTYVLTLRFKFVTRIYCNGLLKKIEPCSPLSEIHGNKIIDINTFPRMVNFKSTYELHIEQRKRRENLFGEIRLRITAIIRAAGTK
jgi:hypothetical protein